MAGSVSPFTDDQRRSLRVLRLVWAACVVQLVVLAGLVGLIVQGQRASGVGEVVPGGGQRPIGVVVGALVAVALGYFIRMQIYKKHWVGGRIERAGYVTGNLILFALAEGGAIFCLVATFLAGRLGNEMIGVLVGVLVLGLNFPHGRPMLDQGPTLGGHP